MSNRPPKPLLVVAPCSARKSVPAQLTSESAFGREQSEVEREWLARLNNTPGVYAVERLYTGRAFAMARDASLRFEADFGVVSAGLGYLRGEDLAPAYDLAISANVPGSIRRRVTGAFDAPAWWATISGGPFARDMIAEMGGRRGVFLCLSRPYAEMLREPLAEAARLWPDRLRLFGERLDRVLPDVVQRCWMPYDQRLEAIGPRGMRSDFASRAMIDYAVHIGRAPTDPEMDRARVLERLKGAPTPDQPATGRRADDVTLMAAIREVAAIVGPRGADILPYLRRQAGWACEQKRFSTLYQRVRQGTAL